MITIQRRTTCWLLLIYLQVTPSLSLYFDSYMKCSYGERGSLTSTCVNATPTYFKTTNYRFDYLDETLQCQNCNLTNIAANTFDISGNQIKSLLLPNSQIETLRQGAFIGLIFMENLDLSNNRIRAIYPGTFSAVKKIKTVNMENNSISTLAEDGFKELINLNTLILSHNEIKILDHRAFNGLDNLRILKLAHNKINDVAEIFNNLTALEFLDLSENEIEELTSYEFDNLTALLELKLSHNRIKSIPPLEFVTMKSLLRLDLSFNFIINIEAGSFKGMESLESLDLSKNHISDVPRKTLQSLHNLLNLNMSYNLLTRFHTGRYSGLPELNSLNLSHNSIEQIEVTGVFPIHSLHTLDLSYNNLTDLNYIALLHRMPKLTYLQLQNNEWPCALEKDMNKDFDGENFKYVIEEKQNNNTCVDRPRTKSPEYFDIKGSQPLTVEYSGNNSANIWVFVLISFIIVLLAVMFYLQYRLFTQINFNPILNRRTTSVVQLISSDLEARDNDDYLKD